VVVVASTVVVAADMVVVAADTGKHLE